MFQRESEMAAAGTQSLSIHLRYTLPMLMALVALLGCASAPVQQMSDARQAIKAAQDAGAAKSATGSLTAAQTLLSQAEKSLKQHQYRAARRDAQAAHQQATEALQATRAKQASASP